MNIHSRARSALRGSCTMHLRTTLSPKRRLRHDTIDIPTQRSTLTAISNTFLAFVILRREIFCFFWISFWSWVGSHYFLGFQNFPKIFFQNFSERRSHAEKKQAEWPVSGWSGRTQ